MCSVFFTLIYFTYYPSVNAPCNWSVFLGGHIHTHRVQLVVSDSSFSFHYVGYKDDAQVVSGQLLSHLSGPWKIFLRDHGLPLEASLIISIYV